ncbi:MAG: hypothetical protein JWM11_7389 [Planctomycetaceae bacterium]|nr:hypothetical protein [Planctomycetaceae bacterium]
MFRKLPILGYCLVLTIVLGSVTSVFAQTKALAPINVAYAGVDRLHEDLDYIFGLASEPKSLKTLMDTLDVFFVGLDPQKPPVVQVHVRNGKFNLVLHVPTTDAKEFRNNARTMGLRSRPIGGGVYQIEKLFNGFMQEFPASANSGDATTIIAASRDDLVPLGQFTTFKRKLESKDYDLVGSIVNVGSEIKDREAAVEALRAEIIPSLERLKSETQNEFEIRKLTLDQEISGLRQFYTEAEWIKGLGNISRKNKQAIFEIDMKPLVNSNLATSLAQLRKEPSYFVNIPQTFNEPLSGMIHINLDPPRQKNLQKFWKQARPLLLKEIADSPASSAQAKIHGSIVTEIVLDVLEQSTQNGVLDGFVNVTVGPSGRHVMIGGAKGDGAIVRQGLVKLKESAPVALDAGMIGDVTLHKVTLPANLVEVEEIFGSKPVLIVGTGPKAIWYALGEGAEAKLKEVIAKTDRPPTVRSSVIASLHAKALVWYKLYDAFRGKRKKGDLEARKEAIAMFEKNDGTFDFWVDLRAETLKSTLAYNEGMLRYFGKTGGSFVKKNLQN